MKKLLIGVLTAVLLIAVIATSVFAANSDRRHDFTDTNGNGICDNRETRGESRGCNFADTNGNGICDNRETCGESRGCNFAGEYGNGRCNNRAERVRRHCGQ